MKELQHLVFEALRIGGYMAIGAAVVMGLFFCWLFI
jgi:hypothetical protein